MSRASILLATLTLLVSSATPSRSQCSNQIALVPLHTPNPAGKPRDFVRFRYSLSTSDSLLIHSHEDTETTIGPYDTGLAITRDGKTTRSVVLRKLAQFRHEDAQFSDGFTTMAVTRACSSQGTIFFVTMAYMGDETSADLFFAVVPTSRGYQVSDLPIVSGGVLEVSTANPLHLRAWENLSEGMCNACETHYRITDYEILDGKPIRTRSYRTKHLYTSGNPIFDDRRRIRFIP